MSWFRSFGTFEVALVIAFVGLYVLYLSRVARAGRQFETVFGNISFKFIFRLLIFALLLIAFMGPSFGSSKVEVKSIGKDILMCVDLSKSMDAFDIPPTRIEKIKFEMKRIVKAFSSDQIGVIIFSSEAFVQSPLTHDQNALNLFIETMSTGLVPPSGTDFTPPLKLALKKLTDQDFSSSQRKSKIIILVSDGEDFGEDRDDIAEQINREGIKLYTLGVGTHKGSQLRAKEGFKTDRQGNTVVTRLNAKSLRSLAEKTGGSYFEISENKNDVSRLISEISTIEGELKDARYLDISSNRYHPFLLAALFLLLLDTLATTKVIRI